MQISEVAVVSAPDPLAEVGGVSPSHTPLATVLLIHHVWCVYVGCGVCMCGMYVCMWIYVWM